MGVTAQEAAISAIGTELVGPAVDGPLGVHDPGEGRTARPGSFATFATAVAFGCQFDHTAPPSGRDYVADLAVDAIASGVGEGLPPVRDLFNKPTFLTIHLASGE